MREKVLVVAAHPDDEILGCGGTIARHAQQGDEVHVVIMAEGATSRGEQPASDGHEEALSKLASAAREANALLGAASVTLHALPDNRMDSLDNLDVIKRVESEVQRVAPSIVYTHHAGDLNIDHRIVHEAVLVACRPQPGNTVNTILAFEVASSTEWQPGTLQSSFMPNWFVDIGDMLEKKLAALAIYEMEMRPWPHARSIRAVEHLSRWRGATVGKEAAEAFQLARRLT